MPTNRLASVFESIADAVPGHRQLCHGIAGSAGTGSSSIGPLTATGRSHRAPWRTSASWQLCSKMTLPTSCHCSVTAGFEVASLPDPSGYDPSAVLPNTHPRWFATTSDAAESDSNACVLSHAQSDVTTQVQHCYLLAEVLPSECLQQKVAARASGP